MRRAMQFLTGLVGLGVAGMGLLLALAYLLLSRTETEFNLVGSSPALQTTVAFALAALSVGLGLPLAWTAFRAYARVRSPVARLPSPWLFAAAFIVVVAAGQAVLSVDVAAPVIFPPFHALASLLPPLLILAAVARPLLRAGIAISRRDLVLNLASGAFIATNIAITLELLAVLALVIVAIVVLALTPGGMEAAAVWAERFSAAQALNDTSWLQDLARNPWLIAAVGSILVIVAPAAEEALKGMGVLFLGYRRPTRAQAFIWGVAGGAGFALAEGLFNGALGLQTWGFTAVARAAAAVMHATGGGLTGLGWQSLLTTRRPWHFFGFYIFAVALHSLWNAAAGGISLIGLRAVGNVDDDMAAVAAGGIAAFLLVALIIAVWLVAIGTLAFWTARLRRERV
ncbi:MAG: PrsW family intramembrane metalloprotease [Anaerolineae bacterium]|nr:PrsW family intramembrane metalloprotease [Anaerolineae bacterium]